MLNQIINNINIISTRNKLSLVLIKPEMNVHFLNELEKSGYNYLDVGFEIAKFITLASDKKYLSVDVQDHFYKLIKEYSFSNATISSPTIILSNIGILFEADLQLNVTLIISNLSKSFHVVLAWNGLEKHQSLLTWPNNETKFSLNFSQIPINLYDYEIQ